MFGQTYVGRPLASPKTCVALPEHLHESWYVAIDLLLPRVCNLSNNLGPPDLIIHMHHRQSVDALLICTRTCSDHLLICNTFEAGMEHSVAVAKDHLG